METAGGTATAFSLAPSALPVWSQDGRTLLYEVGTPQNLFRQDLLRRAAPERLTTSQSVQLPNDWSRDGRFILYQETSPPGDNGNDLMVLELGADGKPIRSRPWLNSKSSEMDGRFSPELHPRWVTYYSRETGRLEVYIDSFPERRAKVQISTDGGRFPQWRGDGRELFFQSLDFKLMSVDVKLGRNSVQTSAPRELFPLPMAHNNLPPYEAAADGQRFLVRTAEHDTELLSLVTNWPALLRKHPG
jgi:Tol biopolymer transport system component